MYSAVAVIDFDLVLEPLIVEIVEEFIFLETFEMALFNFQTIYALKIVIG